MDGDQDQRPSSHQRVRELARRAARLYKGSALILLNVLVLYLLLNVFVAISFRIYDAWKERSDPHARLDPVTINYGPEVLDRVYPG
jgi:hypothetical protein